MATLLGTAQDVSDSRPADGRKSVRAGYVPLPSGDGLHVGHPEGYTATDIVARFERMRGKTVLHPIGFDAFGLPAEEHAIRTNTPPRESTERNIATFRRQLKMLGFSYDWDRQLATTDVDYVRWTQWIFLVLFDTWFDPQQSRGRPIAELPIPADVAAQGATAVRRYQDEHRLAYQAEALVNWCPALGTVLANEEVVDGKSERGGHPVERRPLRQWMLRITAYADRLENDLASARLVRQHQEAAERLDWPQHRRRGGFLHRRPGGLCRVASDTPAGRLSAQGRRRCAAHLHDAPRHAVWGHLHGDCAGASVCRKLDDAPSSNRR